MITLPDFLKPFQKQAETLLAEGTVGHIEFSGNTYQVQVNDPQIPEEVWAFLQFDAKGFLKDRFCSCQDSGDVFACSHIAAAYLRIFSTHETPLHTRLQYSLWNRLCQWYAGHLGDDPALLKKMGTGTYLCQPREKKVAVSIKGLTPEGRKTLHEMFFERQKETEETSLKFSNLSQEEIRLWRQGRPSSQLKYELSFWNDIAKWLMLLQDSGQNYSIRFDFAAATALPKTIHIHFSDVAFTGDLPDDLLLHVIPSLATVSSPLGVHVTPQNFIQCISYDEKTAKMTIIAKENALQKGKDLENKGVKLQDWFYIPHDGFYSRRRHPLLQTPILEETAISDALNRHYSLIKTLLTGATVHEDAVNMSYLLTFDSDWNFLITSYLFTPGDLDRPCSRLFDDWAYLEKKGFFPVEEIYFDSIKTVIAEKDVGNFVRQHRAWLNQQEGFHIHLSGVETTLAYTLTAEDELVFHREAMMEEEPMKIKDFGSWVYISGQGFFSKTAPSTRLSVPIGVPIKREHISSFIRNNQEELQLLSKFFSRTCPLDKVGIKILLTDDNHIFLDPEYQPSPRYQQHSVKVFDDYTFVEGEGFCLIPPEFRLPERFRHPLLIERENVVNFVAKEIDALRVYTLFIDPRLRPPESLRVIADHLSEREGKYHIRLRYQSPKDSLPFFRVWQAVHQDEKYLFSEAGLIDVQEDRYRWIKALTPGQVDPDRNEVTLSSLELLRLQAFDPVDVVEGGEHLARLLGFSIPKEPTITPLKSELRPYQQIGVRWLWSLYQQKLSGLLCDDMGLGKTHQAMGLFAAVMSECREKKHFLVVCPTSVLYHWEEKMQEFLPDVRICTFHGSNRSLKDFQRDYDVLLTSYGIWRNENALLSRVSFEVAIFDEMQAAKTQGTRIHRSLLNVNAPVRFGLTGTPIENRLKELKALFDIILPGYFPSEDEYKKFFITPIEKEQNAEHQLILSRLIKPFILRRKKEDVLFDLPEKTEEISHCELSSEQRVLYNEVLHKARDGLVEKIQDRISSIPYIHIFSVLSSLKQICNHPAAYLKDPKSYQKYQSGKWDLFVELCCEALSSGQKVVVFSQYLAMLDIIELYLKSNGIAYASIRGATKKRGEEIMRFNRDPSCEVFVGSLQASGLGIDLTSGSVVIHYDRWWNAARENQATDRVHRIGQTRGVQVFKLVTKKTFEERIDEIIVRKGKLMEEVIGYDDHQMMKQFDREEIMQLLKDVAD
ncbi:MAG: SNF2-related protein [Waddliaceae bacterium]